MTIHAFSRRIQITSTYHVKRRANRRVKPAYVAREATDVYALWGAFGGLVAVATALVQLAVAL